jgi:hypothetical protein
MIWITNETEVEWCHFGSNYGVTEKEKALFAQGFLEIHRASTRL